MADWLTLPASDNATKIAVNPTAVEAVLETTDFGHSELYVASGQILRVAVGFDEMTKMLGVAPPPAASPKAEEPKAEEVKPEADTASRRR